MNPINARRLFLEYVDRINQLHARPESYNALTTNYTIRRLVASESAQAVVVLQRRARQGRVATR